EVDLVPHRGDRRNGARRDGTRDALVVEGPEVLARAAASTNDHRVGASPTIELIERVTEIVRRPLALDGGRDEHQPHAWRAPGDHGGDVVQRCAIGTRDHGDHARVTWQWTLPLGREQ